MKTLWLIWASNEENSPLRQLVIPTVIGITLVDNDHAAFGEIKLATHRNIMPDAISDGRKGGKRPP